MSTTVRDVGPPERGRTRARLLAALLLAALPGVPARAQAQAPAQKPPQAQAQTAAQRLPQTAPQVPPKPLAGQTVRLVRIDALSGPMGPVGANQLRSYQFFAEQFSADNPAGVRFEVQGMDNKLSPTETLSLLKAAIDQGVRYVIQGNGSSVAGALIDAVNKHNERNPGQEVLYLNDAAVDPDLTNAKCSYWHFRFDADTSMKVEAMTSFIKDQPDIRQVYLLNQNYAHGQQVARYAREALARKRPDIRIVGEDLHPLAQVRDFAPYVAKIKASGADTVITGNWGADLALLVKAAHEGGYTGRFHTYYAAVTGTPTALGGAGAGRVFQVNATHPNLGPPLGARMREFRQKTGGDFYTGAVVHIYAALSQAMAQAKSTDPVKVAAALEGLKFRSFNGEVEMRRADHQLQQPLFVSVWQPADAAHPYVLEQSGMTLAPLREFPAWVASTPTSCRMKRPGAG